MSEFRPAIVENPSSLLEALRGVAASRKLRLFAVACCRRIESHLSDDCRAALQVAEAFANGLVNDELRMNAQAIVKSQCIYVDGDSSPEDRFHGFAAEAALNCVFGDNDYPPIPTYATTCAIAAAGAVVEVVIAECELRRGPDTEWQERAAVEEQWQCATIRKMFG